MKHRFTLIAQRMQPDSSLLWAKESTTTSRCSIEVNTFFHTCVWEHLGVSRNHAIRSLGGLEWTRYTLRPRCVYTLWQINSGFETILMEASLKSPSQEIASQHRFKQSLKAVIKKTLGFQLSTKQHWKAITFGVELYKTKSFQEVGSISLQ